MSRECKDCKGSILNKQESLIPDPKCTDNCDEETVCTGITTYTDCVSVNVNIECADVTTEDTLSEALVKIAEIACDQEAGCTVSVTADDTCCGYLIDKLTSDNQSVTFEILENEAGCQKINIEINPSAIVWHTMNLTSNFATISGVQVPQYSDPDALGRVWFRGSATCADGINLASGSITNFITSTLPVNFRPLFKRITFNGKVAGASSQVPEINVLANGVIQIKNSTTNILDNKGIICFDGFVIEIA